MSFPKNLPESPLLPSDAEPLGGFPADAGAPPTLAWGQRLFRRYERPPSRLRTTIIHLGLFFITLATTVLAGVSLTRGGLDFIDFSVFSLPAAVRTEELSRGLTYAVVFL